MATVLDEDIFPIVGWAGPGGAMIRPDVMQGMRDAGFTISHSSPSPGERLRALDIAHEAGMRLLLCDPAYFVGDDFQLTQAKRDEIAAVVAEVRDHPGLYGYHLRDEPKFDLFGALAEVVALFRDLDPYHLAYINHYPPVTQHGWGAGSIEVFWREYIRTVKPIMLSYDYYPLQVVTRRELADADPADPTYFPAERLRVKPESFEPLELVRRFSLEYDLPFWAFTCSVRHGLYPTPTEGHLRFQLMHDLAYGARGLQYFTYAHGEGLIDGEGRRTAAWDMAQRINAEIHRWAPTLRSLRSAAVYHTGPVWSGTRRLAPDKRPPAITCDGDPVTIGVFETATGAPAAGGARHLMLVNKDPTGWARVTLSVNGSRRTDRSGSADLGDQDLLEISPKDGKLEKPWPYSPQAQTLAFSPGQARLLRIGAPEAGVGVRW